MRINKWNWKEFLKKALIRALKTFAQTAVSMITVGSAVHEVQWVHILSVSGVAFIASIFTSLATGLPEVDGPTPEEIDDAAGE